MNEDNNRSLFVLTIVTVLALPINIIAGLLGMNVGGVPLAQHAQGFWIVVGIVAHLHGWPDGSRSGSAPAGAPER